LRFHTVIPAAGNSPGCLQLCPSRVSILLGSCDLIFLSEARFPLIHSPAVAVFDFGSEEKIAAGQTLFGHPSNFAYHIEKSKWMSFTTTLHAPTFFELIRNLTGNVPGEGGLITFPESSWLASIVLPLEPHFIAQPEGVQVFWGYGLFVDIPGNFVKKPMSACTGREIMTEVIGHLRLQEHGARILDACTCIPCMMPFITSQFLPRSEGDRPQVRPEGSKNLAFVGQYCELPADVVFTVEYSIRSAQTAVYSLLGLDRKAPPVYKGQFNPRVLLEAFLALHEIGV
jgi:oleate hydratase